MKKITDIKTNIKKEVVFLKNITSNKQPVIVYQFGKVASSSIHKSLEKANYLSFQVHFLDSQNIKDYKQKLIKINLPIPNHAIVGSQLSRYLKYLIITNKPLKIITLIREPIGRNISAFFEGDNFEMFNNYRFDPKKKYDIDCLINNFIKASSEDLFPLECSYFPLKWFDLEMKKALGIDIYQYPFPKEKGILRVKHNNIDILILKSKIEDSLKEKSIAEFLGVDSFKIIRSNVSDKKKYNRVYQEFTNKIKLPRDYLEKMCSSKYTKHFYSKDEIDKILAKWS